MARTGNIYGFYNFIAALRYAYLTSIIYYFTLVLSAMLSVLPVRPSVCVCV